MFVFLFFYAPFDRRFVNRIYYSSQLLTGARNNPPSWSVCHVLTSRHKAVVNFSVSISFFVFFFFFFSGMGVGMVVSSASRQPLARVTSTFSTNHVNGACRLNDASMARFAVSWARFRVSLIGLAMLTFSGGVLLFFVFVEHNLAATYHFP